ncbi:hypothetical protein EXIGLDRAFT_752266 [Exidia glandulosa HHB12029]|uniref:F-box domain-containing protein n=1 Tax=Exidia glandulosa HHB12029 TaxID=1314781 RepID=A0A165EPB0_EXIGL|nr:hypothetical protein EXIGLDRAFT_752266 [Exidia glandulosa HHB12029]
MPAHPLQRLSLVNKHWSAVARKDLYARVFVHTEQTVRRLLRTVTEHGDLLDLIKSITVDYKYAQLPTQKKAMNKEKAARSRTSKLTWKLLLLLRPGRTVYLALDGESLRPYCDETPDDRMIPCLTGLRGLYFEDISSGIDYTPWIRAAAPTLLALSIPSQPIIVSRFNFDGLSFALKCLFIPAPGQGRNLISAAAFKALIKSSALEDLTINPMDNVPTSVVRAELIRAAPTLRRLQFAAPYGDIRTELVQALQAGLQLCTNLRILNLWLREDGITDAFASGIPPTVQHMIVCVESVPTFAAYSSVDATLGRVGRLILGLDLPRLETLKLSNIHLRVHPNVTLESLELPETKIHVSLGTEFPRNLPWLY